MSNDNNNTTSNIEFLPASQCIPWVVALIIECLAIVILNVITIIVFLSQPQLKSRGTYLLIRNLAIVDLLVGAISGPLQIERMGDFCDSWEYKFSSMASWDFLIRHTFLHIFSFASLANLVAISLDRVHATFYPSRHVFINKRVYLVAVSVIWLVAVAREAVQIAWVRTRTPDPDLLAIINFSLYVAYYLISLLVICLSYIFIFIRIRFSPHLNSMRSNVSTRERQLTTMLFIVTVASLFALLPVIVFVSVQTFQLPNLSLSSEFHIRMTVIMFFLANSLANPIIYSMRMQPFRAGLAVLFAKTPRHVDAVDLHLRHV